MSNFIQWANFPKILPYAQLFQQGLVVTVLLSLFTVMIGFVLALILAVMRLSNFRPFRSLGLDKDGHLRDGGFLLALSKFNPLDFRLRGDPAFHPCSGSDPHHLLRRVQRDQAALLHDLRLHQV